MSVWNLVKLLIFKVDRRTGGYVSFVLIFKKTKKRFYYQIFHRITL